MLLLKELEEEEELGITKKSLRNVPRPDYKELSSSRAPSESPSREREYEALQRDLDELDQQMFESDSEDDEIDISRDLSRVREDLPNFNAAPQSYEPPRSRSVSVSETTERYQHLMEGMDEVLEREMEEHILTAEDPGFVTEPGAPEPPPQAGAPQPVRPPKPVPTLMQKAAETKGTQSLTLLMTGLAFLVIANYLT